ncbi:unnamed protein product [Lupinus luteus]|uniref:Hexosyltransferase n=1 Tax=Lupinus luteus TaxID=3873 RepID=A0AAV1VZQ4_LUPLU
MAPPENIETVAKPSSTFSNKLPRHAYVTFLAGNGDYVNGVIGLVKGLRKVKSEYPLVVAVLPDVPIDHRQMLEEQGCIVRQIEPVYPPENKELGQPPSKYFNAGMFVFEPNMNTYYDLLRTLKVTPPTPFAEQDFLNMYFKDIYKPIPLVYNLVLAMLWRHPQNVELHKVKVVHYCAAGSKPWRYTGKEENMQREDIKMLVKKWWNIYNDDSLDYKKSLSVTEESNDGVDIEPFSQVLSVVGKVHYVTAPSAA